MPLRVLSEQFKNLSDDEIKSKSAALRQKFRDEVTARLDKQGLEWRELETEIDIARHAIEPARILLDIIDDLADPIRGHPGRCCRPGRCPRR